MPVNWQKTRFPGVRFYEHATRKHGIRYDRYYAIRYQHRGNRHEEGLGWSSEGWSENKAYEELAKLKRAATQGEGPTRLAEAREIEEARRREEEMARRREVTVAKLVEEYIERHAKRNKVRWQEDQRALEYDLVPVLGDWLAKDITRHDASNLLEGIVRRGSPVQACNVLEKCRKMFNLAVEWGYVEYNPFAGMKKPAPRPERDRVLIDEEIRIFWNSIAPGNFGISMSLEMRRAFRLMLVTGQRPGEVIGMHRREIDGQWWTIPRERSKSRRPHRVYLTNTALELIGDGDGYIFPSPREKNRPIAENAMALSLRRNILGAGDGRKVKELSGRKRQETLKKLENPTLVNRIGVEHFVPHDLRRTFLTGLAKIRVPYEVRERIVNHSLGKLERTYNLHDYDEEKVIAMQKWDAHLGRIVSGRGEEARVISLFPG